MNDRGVKKINFSLFFWPKIWSITKCLLTLHRNHKNNQVMNKKELIQQLIHKRMEARALLEAFKILDPKRYERDLDKLLDRINEIDKLIEELNRKN